MIFRDLTKEITEKLLQEWADQQRSARIAEYETRYAELQSNVFTRARRETYWPRLNREKPPAYEERTKIWVPWNDLVSRRLASVCLSGKCERKFEPLADTDQGEADRANELLELTNEIGDWEAAAHAVYYHALGIGEISLWPEYRAFSRETGEPYATAAGSGVVYWQDWFPWFVEPIISDERVNEPIGAVKLYFWDGFKATAYLKQTVATATGPARVVAEIYLAPIFDHITGNQTCAGTYKKWVNGIEDYKGVPDALRGENPYACNPVVTFRGPDPDESGYRGRSYGERFRDLAIQHSRLISNIGQAIDVLPNIWKYRGDPKNAEKIVIRTNEIACIPEGDPPGDFAQAARELNLTEDWNLANYIDSLIHVCGQLPQGFLRDMAGSGKTDSGTALKIVFQPIIEAMQSIRAEFGKAEKRRMVNTVKIVNTNNAKPIILNRIRPEVSYNQDLVPANEMEDIANDLKLLADGVLALPDLVKKYNPTITTDEQVQAFMAENEGRKRAAQPQPFAIPSLRGGVPPQTQPNNNPITGVKK